MGIFYLPSVWKKGIPFKWDDFFFYYGSSNTPTFLRYKRYTLVNTKTLENLWEFWRSSRLVRIKGSKLQITSGSDIVQPYEILYYDGEKKIFRCDCYGGIKIEGELTLPEVDFPPFDEATAIELPPLEKDPCLITQLPAFLQKEALKLLEEVARIENLGKLLLALKTRLFPLLPGKTQGNLVRNLRKNQNFPPLELVKHIRKYFRCIDEETRQLLVEYLV